MVMFQLLCDITILTSQSMTHPDSSVAISPRSMIERVVVGIARRKGLKKKALEILDPELWQPGKYGQC